MIAWNSKNESHVLTDFVLCWLLPLRLLLSSIAKCWRHFEKQAFIVHDPFPERSMATKIKPFCHCLVKINRKILMLTWPNGIDLQSSGKIENVLERSLRQKKTNNQRQKLAITNNPKCMMGNRQEGNGGRFTLWKYAVEKLKSSRVERIQPHQVNWSYVTVASLTCVELDRSAGSVKPLLCFGTKLDDWTKLLSMFY